MFEKGREKTGGRGKGVKNRLCHSFLSDLLEDYERDGKEVFKILRVEHPDVYAKLIASFVPKEFEITDSRLKEIPDDELDAIIEHVRSRQGSVIAGDIESGEGKTLN